MRLGFIFFIGLFSNLLLATIFPYQVLPESMAADLVGNDVYNYQQDNNDYFNSNLKDSTGQLYANVEDTTQTSNLLGTNQQESNFIESVSFFDGLTDALSKIGKYISLILPFSTVISLLPGAIGFIFGALYSGVIVYGIARFIRGA